MTLNINLSNMNGFGWVSSECAAFLSLRTALEAYFETYKATYFRFSKPIDLTSICRLTKFEGSLYKKLYFTTIVQF